MKTKLVITATLMLPDDALAASKLQTAALEAGALFKKAIQEVDKKADYEAGVHRIKEGGKPRKTPAAPKTEE